MQLNTHLSAQEIEELERARDRWIGLIEEGRRRGSDRWGAKPPET